MATITKVKTVSLGDGRLSRNLHWINKYGVASPMRAGLPLVEGEYWIRDDDTVVIG